MAAKALAMHETTIPGLVLVDLPVHGDNRGWFKENWQREKMLGLGLPDFGPVQNNISFNDAPGTTRGIHAEPWDKFVSVAAGRIFGAWVDLREGPSFGAVFTAELGPDTAIFVPRGVGNSYQTLEENTSYVYLVNEHWSAEAQDEYTFLNLEDETVAIDWPIPLVDAERSPKDLGHPRLLDVVPMPAKRTLVIGANGQLGRALAGLLTDADFADRSLIDLTNPESLSRVRWNDYAVVVNAAAFTAVDAAETPEGRAECWAANVSGVAEVVRIAAEHRITLVHVSSDYVFDGTKQVPYREEDSVSPLGVYGQTKAAGDAIVSTLQRHYIVRTSWVVGDGSNFVRTMASLAARGIDPAVVDDQIGRLSFAEEIAAGIVHLIRERAEYGTYNLTNAGEPQSWADIARSVFKLTGHDSSRVSGISTAEYFENKLAAPRPRYSMLNLDKVRGVGFEPRDAQTALTRYLAAE